METFKNNPNIISKDDYDNISSKYKYYERHNYDDPEFPIIFHYDMIDSSKTFMLHWHQNPEILYFKEGEANITIDTEVIKAASGDIVIVPSNFLHKVTSDTYSKYYCLIPDWEFCKNFCMEFDNINFAHQITDNKLNKKMDIIVNEIKKAESYYKPIVLSEIISFFGYAARHFAALSPVKMSKSQAARTEMIKKTLSYVDEHYDENVTIDALADYVGFTRYYFCHIFKQLTGMTPISYINYIRCRKAKGLLLSGKCENVSDAAELCGFSNLSYFTRTYKKFNGHLPSNDMHKVSVYT